MNRGQITTGTIIAATSIVTTLVLGLFGYSLSASKENNTEIQEVKKDLMAKGERISAQESTVESYEKRLSRIEDKIDILLERQGIKIK